MTLLAQIVSVLANAVSIYSVVLFVRLVLSWFPNLDWGNPILSAISSITDPLLNVFRGLIPPLGGFDFSSLLALISIQLLQQLLNQSVVLLASASGY